MPAEPRKSRSKAARKRERYVSPRRDAWKQQTRDALIAAALELFVEQGLDGPSLDAICERAGYTRGAFYVHFADRDALLVAVMEKVGEAFLSSVFEHIRGGSEDATPGLHVVAERFVSAVADGAYPLMPGKGPRAKRGPQVRPHQLLDACARSPIVRERYRALVQASIDQVASLARTDQEAGVLRASLDPQQVGTMALATIIGAQTMAELGVAVDPAALARTMLAAFAQ